MALDQTTNNLSAQQDQRKGYNGISLTNFTNTSEPQVSEGSVIEINGAIYKAASDQSISGWGAIGNGNNVYIYAAGGGGATSALSFSTTAPTWDDDAQGYYNGQDRAIAGLYKTDATTYSDKYIFGDLKYPWQYFSCSSVNTTAMTAATDTKQTIDAIDYSNMLGASLSSSVISLLAGRYRINGWVTIAPTGIAAGASMTCRCQVRDTTGASDLLVGQYNLQTNGTAITTVLHTPVHISGYFSLSVTSNIEIQAQASVATSVNNYGTFAKALNIEIWRL
jgi:hypothetical protein